MFSINQNLKNQFLIIEKDLHLSNPEAFLSFFLHTDFSAEKENYRLNIRKKIVEAFSGQLTEQDRARILDLKQLPLVENEKLFFSISHSNAVGGFTAASLAHGFDIENSSRIKETIVHRVSSEDELKQAPHYSYLWPAKEAVLKSFQNTEVVITDFSIHSWVSYSGTGLWSYRSTPKKSLASNINKGYLFLDTDHIFSIFFR